MCYINANIFLTWLIADIGLSNKIGCSLIKWKVSKHRWQSFCWLAQGDVAVRKHCYFSTFVTAKLIQKSLKINASYCCIVAQIVINLHWQQRQSPYFPILIHRCKLKENNEDLHCSAARCCLCYTCTSINNSAYFHLDWL